MAQVDATLAGRLIQSKKRWGKLLINPPTWSVHLRVRIQDFHSCHRGSNPLPTTMGKRYSESSNQDLKNDSAECLRREWDIVG